MKKTYLILIIVIFMLFLTSCTKDISQKPAKCSEQASGKGRCFWAFSGFHYDVEEKKCVEVSLSGCSFETPFSSLIECQNTCE